MSIDQTAEQIIDNLSQEYIDALIQRVCEMLANYAKQHVANTNINAQIQQLVADTVDRAIGTYFWPSQDSAPNLNSGIVETIGTEFKNRTETFLSHLTNRIQNDVIQDIRNFISTTNFNEFVTRTAAETIRTTVVNGTYSFPDHSIPARALQIGDIKITADQITPGQYQNFYSTGIEDRALTKTLIVDKGKVIVEGDLAVSGSINKEFLDKIVSQAAEIILAKLPEGTFNFASVTASDVVELVALHVRNQFEREITVAVNAQVTQYGIKQSLETRIDNIIKSAVDTYVYNKPNNQSYFENTILSGIIASFNKQTEEFIVNLKNTIQQQVLDHLNHAVSQINVVDSIKEQSGRILYDLISRNGISFPPNSVPGSAIDTVSLTLSADNITQGVIRNFQSLGIQDRANSCQITVSDQYTVIENQLVANSLEIKGPVKFTMGLDESLAEDLSERTLVKFQTRSQDGLYDHYAQRVFDRIQQEGITIDHLRLNGKPLFDNGTLSYNVTKSNLQRVGYLKELQVQGESYLSSTLYTSNKRTGFNTMEPEMTVDIWDQEVQIVLGKRSQDIGVIGSPRNQTLLLSTNNKNQLSVNPDGSITVDQLNIGRVRHTSSAGMPVDNRPIGVIVWNENPYIGGPIGWVSLGGARWAGFGTITE